MAGQAARATRRFRSCVSLARFRIVPGAAGAAAAALVAAVAVAVLHQRAAQPKATMPMCLTSTRLMGIGLMDTRRTSTLRTPTHHMDTRRTPTRRMDTRHMDTRRTPTRRTSMRRMDTRRTPTRRMDTRRTDTILTLTLLMDTGRTGTILTVTVRGEGGSAMATKRMLRHHRKESVLSLPTVQWRSWRGRMRSPPNPLHWRTPLLMLVRQPLLCPAIATSTALITTPPCNPPQRRARLLKTAPFVQVVLSLITAR